MDWEEQPAEVCENMEHAVLSAQCMHFASGMQADLTADMGWEEQPGEVHTCCVPFVALAAGISCHPNHPHGLRCLTALMPSSIGYAARDTSSTLSGCLLAPGQHLIIAEIYAYADA